MDYGVADVGDVPVKRTKAAAKKSQKAKGAETIQSDGEAPPKKARGRKKSVKVDDDDDEGESVSNEEDSGEPIPPLVKDSRASRKAATADFSKIPGTEDGDNIEEVMEESHKPKKGRKKITGKGSKDGVSTSASFFADFRLTVGPVLRQLALQRPKCTYQIHSTCIGID